MSDLYLNTGESLILTTNRISVNFIPFDLMLTSLRLILLDTVHDRFSPQLIPLADIFSVNGGTIPTGEPIIRITITDGENGGSLIPLDFIFSQAPNQKRKQERDDWLRALMEKLVEVRQEKVLSGIEPSGEEDTVRPSVRRWIAPEILYPMPLVAAPDQPATEPENVPPAPEPVGTGENATGEPERARHPSLEFEGPPVPAGQQEETPGEPTGPDQKTRPEIPIPGEPAPLPEDTLSTGESGTGPLDMPVPHAHDITALPTPDIPHAPEASPEVEPEPVHSVAAISGMEAPDALPEVPAGEVVTISGESYQTPGSDRAIEPSSPDADRPEPGGAAISLPPPVVNWPVIHEKSVSGEQTPEADRALAPSSPGEERPEQVRVSISPPPPAVNWPVIHTEPVSGIEGFGTPVTISPGIVSDPQHERESKPGLLPVAGILDEGKSPVSAGPAAGPDAIPVPKKERVIPGTELVHGEPSGGIPVPRSLPPASVDATVAGTPFLKRTMIISIAVAFVIIFVVAALVVISLPVTPAGTPPPLPPVPSAITVNTTPAITPVATPGTGVWVRVVYPGFYHGQVGNPSGPEDIGGTGDQLYFIRNSGNLVQADIQKRDYSGDTLTVSVYNNGTLVFNTSVRSPMGTISVLIDPATGKPPVPHA